MTYNVFGGTLSLTQSINQPILHAQNHRILTSVLNIVLEILLLVIIAEG